MFRNDVARNFYLNHLVVTETNIYFCYEVIQLQLIQFEKQIAFQFFVIPR